MDMDCRPDSSAGQMQSQTYTPGWGFSRNSHRTPAQSQQTLELNLPSKIGTHSLPVEILAEIFLHCLGPFEYITPRRRDAPLLLCQICQHWRGVALSTPLLWSSLEVHGRPPMPQLVQLWLERSQPCPISLSIAPNTSNVEWKTGAIFDYFLEHVSRWKVVSFRLDDNLASRFSKSNVSAATLLESMVLRISSPDAECAKLALAYQMPSLRQFSWWSPFESSIQVSWSQLSAIHLAYDLSLGEAIRILSQCSQAVDVTLSTLTDSEHPPPTITLLPNLQTFRVWTSFDIVTLLDYFALPSLRTLSVDQRPSTGSRDIAGFAKFLQRSSCKLADFRLCDSWLAEDDILGYLSIPRLEPLSKLDITSNHISDRVLSLLTPTNTTSDSVILPRLREILLADCCSTDGRFADVVSARWLSPAENRRVDIVPLERVCITFSSMVVGDSHAMRLHSIKEQHQHDLLILDNLGQSGLKSKCSFK